MWCVKCNHDLSECVCPDLEERLARLREVPEIHAPSVIDKPLLQRKLKKEQPKPKDQ